MQRGWLKWGGFPFSFFLQMSVANRYGYDNRSWGRRLLERYGPRMAQYAGRQTGRYVRRQVARQVATRGRQSARQVTERPTNDDTDINTNNTFNATSLYTSRGKRKWSATKKKRVRKQVAFKKKVKRVFKQVAKPNSHHWYADDLLDSEIGVISEADQFQYIHPTAQAIILQGMLAVGLPPGVSTTRGVGLIFECLGALGWVENGATDSTPVKNNMRLWYQERLNITIKNIDTTDVSEEFKCFMDIYECVAAKNLPADTDGLKYDTPQQAWATCLGGENCEFPQLAASGITRQLNNHKGLRPSDCPIFQKYWKIAKVTRVQYTGNTEYLYQLNTSGIMDFDKSNLLKTVAGQTKTIMCIVDGVGIINNDAPYNSHLQFQSTKTIKWKRLDNGIGGPVNPATPQTPWYASSVVNMT